MLGFNFGCLSYTSIFCYIFGYVLSILALTRLTVFRCFGVSIFLNSNRDPTAKHPANASVLAYYVDYWAALQGDRLHATPGLTQGKWGRCVLCAVTMSWGINNNC